MSTTNTYRVEGMTCDHCARAVRAEVAEVPGVVGVDVDVAAKRVTVTSEGEIDDDAIRAAVVEAGYEAPR